MENKLINISHQLYDNVDTALTFLPLSALVRDKGGMCPQQSKASPLEKKRIRITQLFNTSLRNNCRNR